MDFSSTVNALANQAPTITLLDEQSHQEGISLSIGVTDPAGDTISGTVKIRAAVGWEIPGSGAELIEGQYLSSYVINNLTVNNPTQTK